MVPNTPPSFPPELEREMFEMAATEHPNMMPTLVLVAHRVLQWIEPLLYRTLLLMQDLPRDKTALLLAIQRTPAKFTKYVQNLLVWPGEASPHDECAMLLISLCSGISRLALFDPKPTMLPALDNMRLDHLSVSLAILFGHSSNPGEINPDRPLFQALTHLCLWDDSRMIDGLPIAKLPALTHLCVNGRQDSLFLLSTLRNCAQFRVLVHMYWTRVALGRAQQTPDVVDDLRFVLMTLDVDGYLADWRAGAKGGQDFWARADRFIAKKKRGEIKPGRMPASHLGFHYELIVAVSRCWIVDADLIE